MAEEQKISEMMRSHPLWDEYKETMEIIREVRPGAEAGSDPLNARLDLLEERASDLINQMTSELGIPDKRRDNPLWQKWDEKWKDLRRAKRENRTEEEETIWGDLKEIGEKIDLQNKFSDN